MDLGSWLLVTSDALSWIGTKETRWVEMRAIDELMLLENTGKMWTTRSLIYSPFAGPVRHAYAHAAMLPCHGAHACQQQGRTRLASLGQKAMVVHSAIPSRCLRSRKTDLLTMV